MDILKKSNEKEYVERNYGADLLRSLAMLMVVVLHYLSKGGILTEVPTGTWPALDATAWVMEGLCIVAVNVYMLISGYFLCTSHFGAILLCHCPCLLIRW